MSVQTRPSDQVTEDFLVLGLPVIEFAFQTGTGAYGAYFGLGIPDSTEVQKALQTAQLRNPQSGTSKLVRELVRQFDASLQVGCFRHSGENMQLMFGSASLTDVSASVTAVTDDLHYTTDDEQDFLDLANQHIIEPISAGVNCAPISGEEVGTGDGTSGDTSGDFSLDFKPLVIGDVTSVTVGGTAYTPIAVGAAASGLEVEIVVGTGATSGDMQFFSGGVATNVTGAILASYAPSHSFVENTDYVVDYKSGRVRYLNVGGSTDALKAEQPMHADYSYNQYDHQLIYPFSQFVFPGRARVRQLTDVGSNWVWLIPKAEIRLTEDSFVFNKDDFTVTNLLMNFLEDTSVASQPYGSLKIYREGTF